MSTQQAEPEIEEAGGRSKKKLLIAVVVVLALAVGAWWFVLRPVDTEPVPGEVLRLEPIQINLSGGQYLRIGVALQTIEGAHEIDGSQALDATIDLFSGRSTAELGDAKRRGKLKTQLLAELEHRYHGEVMEVYFTDFVTQ